MSLLRGCPIPDMGVATVRAICFPSTWAGLLSNLLLQPVETDFWEILATDAQKIAASQIATDIVHDFLSPSCECAVDCSGTDTEQIFDFAAGGLQGWTLSRGSLTGNGLEGEYVPGFPSYQMLLQAEYHYPTPRRLKRFEIAGSLSRFTYDPIICGASFVSADVGMQAYRSGLGPFAAVGFGLGAQYGSAPISLSWYGPSCELIQDIYVSMAFVALTDTCAQSCQEIIEEIRLTYRTP